MAGVSIGSYMGALWCQERDIGKITVKEQLIVILLLIILIFSVCSFCVLVMYVVEV